MTQGDTVATSSMNFLPEEKRALTERPLVSIIAPVLNGARYLEACVNSVLSQDYPRIEHIFVDGGSTDGTMEMLSTFAQKYPGRVRVISAPGTGPGEAWNKGAEVAKGEIFGCLGVDDLYVLGAIQSVVKFFEAKADAYFVHGECEIIDYRGEVIGQHRVGRFDLQDFINTARHIATPSAFYKREVIEAIGGIGAGDDFDVMIRIAKRFSIFSVERVLSRLRIHQDSAFSPTTFEGVRRVYQQTYAVSRKHGGSLFSPVAFKYYAVAMVGWCGLRGAFPRLRSLVRGIRRALQG